MSSQIQEGRLAKRSVVGMEEQSVNRSLRGASVSDTGTLPYDATQIYLTRTATAVARGGGRLELGWKQSSRGSVARADDSTPEFVEMAKPGTAFTGAWKDKSTGRAFQSANRFAAGILVSHAQYASTFGLNTLAQSIAALSDRVAALGDSETSCLLPVGWGCGFLGKAAVTDASGEEIRDLLRKLPFYARAIQTGLPFPKTRRIVFEREQPSTLPGWCLLEVRL